MIPKTYLHNQRLSKNAKMSENEKCLSPQICKRMNSVGVQAWATKTALSEPIGRSKLVYLTYLSFWL